MPTSRKRIAFLLYHGTGHFNACFHLARKFKEEHEVIFVGVEYFKRSVESQGFSYYALRSVPFGINLENWVNEIQKKKFIWWQVLKDRWNDRLYDDREKELGKFLHEFNPDYIFIDTLQSTDFIVLYPFVKGSHVRVGFINATYPLSLKENEPPLNSLALPDDLKAIRKAHRSIQMRRWWKNMVQKIKHGGMDDLFIIRRRFKRNKVPAQYLSVEKGLFSTAFRQIPDIYVVPKEFDFPGTCSLDQHFLGLQIDHARIETTAPEFQLQKELIYHQIDNRKSKLIYCAFGTVPLKDRNPVIALLTKIIHATKLSGYTLVISFQITPEEVRQLTAGHDHVFIFKSVPQLELLSQADAFITHCGLNSVKESIDAGVPMLVYLMEAKRDQKGNAARILYHNIGRVGNLLNDSTADIQGHLKTILEDTSMKDSILKLRQPESFSADRVLEILDASPIR